MTIKDKDGKPQSEAKVLQQYFGRKEGQLIAQFMEELKALALTDKTELAALAAKELGYTTVD